MRQMFVDTPAWVAAADSRDATDLAVREAWDQWLLFETFLRQCYSAGTLTLSKSARESLAAHGIHPVQAAFGLAVPMIWREENDQ